MDFDLTKEQRDIQSAAREFARGEFDPDLALDLEREGRFPSEIWRKACKLGFVGLHFPEEYGGQGLRALENLLVAEEFCSHHSGIGTALALCTYGSEMILKFGRDDQKKRYLPAIATGRSASSLAFLGRNGDSGTPLSDATATPHSSGYSINGTNSYVLNGNLPGPIIIMCKLPSAAGGEEQTAFILDKDRDEVSCSSMEGLLGMRMASMSDVVFLDCAVSSESLLGEEGRGQFQLLSVLEELNLLAAAMGAGVAQGAFDLALAYARRRVQFGRKIGSFEAIRDRLADMATRIEISRCLTYRAAWNFEKQGGDRKAAHMAKMVSTENALEVAKNAMHILGGYGYMVEYRVERFYRDAAMLDMIGTVGGVEKGLVADQVIGKL